ncbi:hypothetical protein [Bradyrhizobium sp. 25ACV]
MFMATAAPSAFNLFKFNCLFRAYFEYSMPKSCAKLLCRVVYVLPTGARHLAPDGEATVKKLGIDEIDVIRL